MECRSVHQVAIETWNYLSTTSLPVLAPAGRLCLPPPLPLTADPPQSLFPLALQDPVQLLLLHPTGSSLTANNQSEALTCTSLRSRSYHLPPNPPTNPKKKKEKDKNCLLGKPGITTEQNRTRGGDADTGRGKAFLCSLFLSSDGPGYSTCSYYIYLLPPT